MLEARSLTKYYSAIPAIRDFHSRNVSHPRLGIRLRG